jgi:sulfide:quinone oxidoreductase
MAVVMAKTAAYNIHQQIQGKPDRKEYVSHVNIICIMDTGNGAAIVYRKGNSDFVLPLPVVGHWLKIAWGMFYKWTKR